MRTSTARGATSLDGPAIDALVRRNYWAVLATADGDQPYAVPIVYGYDGSAFYLASSAGLKLDNLLANPCVCLTIAEVEPGATRWRSVVVTGRAEQVKASRERLAAFDALRRQVAPHRAVSASMRDAARLAGAVVVRIAPLRMTGRSRDA